MSEIFGEQVQNEVALLEPSVPRATLEDGTVIEPRSEGALQAGSVARIYRDGHELVGMVNVPQKGALSLRHLPPGSYVLRDECENEAALQVGALEEDAVLSVKGGEPELGDGTAEPGSAVVQHFDVERSSQIASSELTPKFPNVGPGPERTDGGDMIRPKMKAGKSAKVADVVRDDVVVPAEPGSALITPEAGSTVEAEVPEDAAKGVVTEETDQGEDPNLEHLQPTEQERQVAQAQKAEKLGTGSAVDPDGHGKQELRAMAKAEGVSQRGSKDEVAARINAARASKG